MIAYQKITHDIEKEHLPASITMTATDTSSPTGTTVSSTAGTSSSTWHALLWVGCGVREKLSSATCVRRTVDGPSWVLISIACFLDLQFSWMIWFFLERFLNVELHLKTRFVGGGSLEILRNGKNLSRSRSWLPPRPNKAIDPELKMWFRARFSDPQRNKSQPRDRARTSHKFLKQFMVYR